MKVARNGDCIVIENGNVAEIKHRDGTKTYVDEVNDIRITTDKSGRPTDIVRPDGTSTHFNADGSSVTRDEECRITEATDKNDKVILSVTHGDNGPTKMGVSQADSTDTNAHG